MWQYIVLYQRTNVFGQTPPVWSGRVGCLDLDCGAFQGSNKARFFQYHHAQDLENTEITVESSVQSLQRGALAEFFVRPLSIWKMEKYIVY